MKMTTKNTFTAALCGLALVAGLAYAADEKKPSTADGEKKDTSMAGNKHVEEIIKTFKGKGAMVTSDLPLVPAQEAAEEFRTRKDVEVEVVASEPVIGQPLFMSWDHRGRMWVMQYLQYPFPAGLKVVEYDNYLRAVFDKVPEPPPHGVKGKDTITVFEDSNGDGIYDKHKDVITGLNIATSVVVGHGGIWVSNPPYLLFYPDANRDDVPDGDPEVRLSGFGIEDTHSVMSNMKWGPDGWLYGASGSTTTGQVKNPANGKMVEWKGQNIWRYHPDTMEFEIYGEGGGNTFSLDIDAKGRVFSGTNHGNTRGMYYPQGSYGEKGWGKHGPLTNPYAFGYFKHMRHEGDDRRFPQAFMIYEGGLFPESWDGKIIAPNSLQNVVYVSQRMPDTSTYRTKDEENLMVTKDRWFRPVFGDVGADGAIYLADWSDTRLSHVYPVDNWHKESGRIYRVKPKGADLKHQPYDLATAPNAELIALFDSPNRWMRRRAVLELGWRGDKSVLPELEKLVSADEGQKSLEALWALNLLGGLTEKLAIQWLENQDADVRRWVVRLVGDRRGAGPDLGDKLSELAAKDQNAQVRSQLAASAKRLPASVAIPIVRNLLGRSEDLEDLHMPLMDWWALEAHAEDGSGEIENMVKDGSIWDLPLFKQEMAARLMRRYAMAGGGENFERCARLLKLAPDEEAQKILMTGLQQAFQGATIPQLPPSLTEAMDEYSKKAGDSDLVLGVQRGDKEALKKAINVVKDTKADILERTELAKLFGDVGDKSVVAPLLAVLAQDQQSALKRVAMQSLANYDDASIAKTILARYGSSLPAEHNVRSTADRVLASRKDWAKAFLEQVDAWVIKARDIDPDVVQQLKLHNDGTINALVAKHWPDMRAQPAAAKLAEIQRISDLLKNGGGDVGKGEALFAQRCVACHKLFGKGGAVGPDLTGYERGNLEFWLPAIMDPSLEIREGYTNFVVTMKDGRTLIGMIADQNPQAVTLRDPANQLTTLSREQIASLKATPISLMPEGLLMGLKDGELRDLFAYMMKQTGN